MIVASPARALAASSHQALGPAASGAIGLRLVDVPVAEANDPRALLYVVDHLAPGTVIQRRIEVSNTTPSTAHVLLYASAATIANGSFIGADGHTPNDLSTWTSVSPGTTDVPPGGREIATVTINLPIDAAPGERYGVVWAEVRSTPTDGGITQVSRVGIRIYLAVGPGAAPAADFTIESLTAMRSSDGTPLVVATVHNTGGRALDLSGTLQLLAGPGGLSAGPFPADLGVTLGIGDREPVTIALDKRLPAGPWDARILLRSGLLERSARASITFPDAGSASPVDTTSGPSKWLYIGLAALVLLLLVMAALLGGFKHHRPRSLAVATIR